MRGRKTLYKEHMIEEGQKLAELGFTNEEIANFWGRSRRAFQYWLKKYPEFMHTLKVAKLKADKRVEESLYQRALGYEHTEKTFEKRGEELKLVKEVLKEVIPDTTAQIFWLKNRRPDLWRDRQEMGIEGRLNLDNKLTITVVHTDGSGKIETKEIEQIKAADFKELPSPTNDGQKESG